MTDRKRWFCGPKFFPAWLLRILSIRFNVSCRLHDIDYVQKRFKRREADVRFLFHMMKQADDSLVWELVAVLYFVIVRVFGRVAWLWAKEA